MNEPAICVDRVWKSYDIHPAHSLWNKARQFVGRLRGRPPEEPFWALRDVSFEVRKGETLGVIGPNGAGKSTLLKILCGVTRPTRGRIAVAGRVAPLVELGAGFHPDLTGRENVLINGVMLGMTVREVRRKYDAIVDFAGLGEFMDTPVKKYSSGMFARLGFAVAIHTEPDVLLIDEVLAVGDIGFQNKSLRRMAELRERATATVFVTHNLNHARNLCDRIILLGRGNVVIEGRPGDVLEQYAELMSNPEDADRKLGEMADRHTVLHHVSSGSVEMMAVRVEDGAGEPVARIVRGEALYVTADFVLKTPVEAARFVIGALDSEGNTRLFQQSTDDGFAPALAVGRHRLRVRIEQPFLAPGVHFLNFSLYNAATGETLERWHRAARVEVAGAIHKSGAPLCTATWQLLDEAENKR